MLNFFFKSILNFVIKREILYIDSQENWNLFIDNIKKTNVLGIDTEFDWRTTYFPILSLIQVSTKRTVFIIDCKEIENFKEFKSILENKSVLKIFHSVRSDSTVLTNCLDIKLENVYDIQQAERILSNGEIKSKINIEADFSSKLAKEKIEKAGGQVAIKNQIK